MIVGEILIDPRRLVRVKFKDALGQPRDVVAVTCAYVPARASDGTMRVAIEIVFDPSVPHPSGAYYVPSARLERQLVAPAKLERVKPYQG
jgi:hypothetical protein